jgi:t-SNARE complex subunit (syntaxin)
MLNRMSANMFNSNSHYYADVSKISDINKDLSELKSKINKLDLHYQELLTRINTSNNINNELFSKITKSNDIIKSEIDDLKK